MTGPQVKASGGHTPGPMCPVTAVEVSANAALRWRDQYRDWSPYDTFADGTTKESVDKALNSEAHTPEAIGRILNEGWAKPQCDCCKAYADAVVSFDTSWSTRGNGRCRLCYGCIAGAATIASRSAS